MNKSDVVIVVPIYKEELNLTEKTSLQQLYNVLHEYRICFVAPKRMEDYCKAQGQDTVFFDDKFFTSTSSYSELLLSEFFYERFAEYEYMLIYQLDAFVFYDKLLEFCRRGYDYIGAPILRTDKNWQRVKARVGNGGLSLRRVKACKSIVKNIDTICRDTAVKQLVYKYEDMYFGFCGAQEHVDFYVPGIREALEFSADENVAHIFQRMKKNAESLPFGCHGWSRPVMYPIWRSFIADNGGVKELDNHFNGNENLSYRYLQWERITPYIVSRCMSYHTDKMETILSQYLSYDEQYTIWGYGKYGVILHNLLKKFGYKLVDILDVRPKNNVLDETPVIIPNIDSLRDSENVVIIAATDYDTVIKNDILSRGILEQRIIIFREILEKVVLQYVNHLLCVIKL